MIPYIDRDILKNFFATLFVLLAFLKVGFFVAVLLQFHSFIFGGEESKLGWVILYYIFTIPRQVAYTFPVCTAMSILWVFSLKARTNELLAYLSGGVSPTRIARPVVITGFILSVICFLTIDLVATNCDRIAERIRRINIESRSVENLTRERNVFQKGLGDRFYSIPTFDPVFGMMNEPILTVMKPEWDRPHFTLSAVRAEQLGADEENLNWVFYDAVMRTYDDEGNLASYIRKDVLHESELDPPIEEQLNRVLRQRWRPAQMSTMELVDYIDLFRLQGKPTYELSTFLHYNISIAFACFVFALLMCGHILRPSSAGVVIGYGGGMALMALYWTFFIFARQFSKDGHINPWLSAHGINVAFLILGIYLIRRNRAL